MARQTDTVNQAQAQAQDQFRDSVRQSQDPVLTAIRAWSDWVTRLVPDLSSLPAGDQSFEPEDAVDTAFTFAEQLLSTQRQFVHDVLSAMAPVGDAADTTQGQRPEAETRRRGTSVAGVIPEAINARLGTVTREDRLRVLEEIRTLQGRFLPPDEIDRLAELEHAGDRDGGVGGHGVRRPARCSPGRPARRTGPTEPAAVV